MAPRAESPGAKPNRLRLPLLISGALLLLLVGWVLIGKISVWRNRAGEDDLLRIVNAENPAEEDEEQSFTLVGDTQMVDSICAAELEAMLDACREAGNEPLLYASYRTESDQRELYDERVRAYRLQGFPPEEAEALAARSIAPPGCSEHQTGLAVDILSEDCPEPGLRYAESACFRWLAEHSWEYGFILRYGQEQSEVTGMDFHPWHFRYVGADAARQIYELGLTLEEYRELFYD